jgi:hypothetical protein
MMMGMLQTEHPGTATVHVVPLSEDHSMGPVINEEIIHLFKRAEYFMLVKHPGQYSDQQLSLGTCFQCKSGTEETNSPQAVIIWIESSPVTLMHLTIFSYLRLDESHKPLLASLQWIPLSGDAKTLPEKVPAIRYPFAVASEDTSTGAEAP